MKQYIPSNIDIDNCIESNPPYEVEKFDQDNLIHLMHLIHSITANNKDLDVIKGFVPLYSEILRRRIPNYKQYLAYLQRVGIFETDNHYIVGSKSKGYRFTGKYRGRLKAVEITNPTLIKHQTKRSNYALDMARKHRHLEKWFNPKLQINYAAATAFLDRTYLLKATKPSLRDYDIKNACFKSPGHMRNSQWANVQRIADGDFYTVVDTNVRRFHSNLTNLKSELRNFLTYDGQALASVDIANSQPYMSIALMRPSFWKQSKGSKGLSIKDTGTTYNLDQRTISTILSTIMSQESNEMQYSSDFQRFASLVTQNKFYPYLQRLMTDALGEHYNTRKEVKKAVFTILFTSNWFYNQKEAMPKRLFHHHFPNVYHLFSLIKKGDHTRLPRLLQRVESHLVLQKITRRITSERPYLPIFTIHDSVATTIGDEGYVKQVMEEELCTAIGYKPVLKVEYWIPSSLDVSTSGSFYYGEEELKTA